MNILKSVKRNKIFLYSIVIIGVIMLAFPIASDKAFYEVYDVYINDKFVAIAHSEEEAVEAFNDAKLMRYVESNDLTFIEAEMSISESSAPKSEGIDQELLTSQIYDELESCMVSSKVQAYTIKIDNYTVTLRSREEVVSVLERTQQEYDVDDQFKVCLTTKESSGISNMGVSVVTDEEFIQMSSSPKESQPIMATPGTEATSSTEATSEVETKPSTEATSEAETTPETEPTQTGSNSQEDGIKHINFKENIDVFETYTYEDNIMTVDEAYEDITKKKDKKERYEVKEGDSLYGISDSFGITLDELLAMNEGMTTESLILVGDELTVSVPRAEVSIVVEEQLTYDEEYSAEVEYVDDDSMYIGETTTIQEGSIGKRTVTAMITLTDGVEIGRIITNEKVTLAAVPTVIHRGTKAIPTYIKPLSNGTFTSGFGQRWGRSHEGIDWGVAQGTAIKATRAGVITQAGWWGGYGYCVIIDHGDGVTSRYGHMSEVQVSVGQTVNQGDRLGLSGNTGNSTGPHLHFEIRVNGVAQDPADYVEY